MPGLVMFGRRWGFGSDDLVIPTVACVLLHTAWICVLGLLLGVADFDVDAEVQGRAEGQEEGEGHGDCGADLWRNVVGFLVTLCVTLTLEVAVAVVSMRGSILNVHPRSAIPYLLYIRLAVLGVELIWQILGVVCLVRHYNTCHGSAATRAVLGVIVCNGLVTFGIVLSLWCTYDSAGRSWLKMKRYQQSLKSRPPRNQRQKRCSGNNRRNWRQRKAIRKYEQSWDRRCRLLFCCVKEDRHRNSFAEIAKLFTEFFRELDVVPSDIFAGLVLLRRYQKLRQKRIVTQGSNDVYEFLSGVPVTPVTSFVDVTRDDVMREYRTVVHYMRYALAAYGWPMYMMMNTGTGFCRILPRLRCCICGRRCCAGRSPSLVDDNCCRCNFAALRNITGLHKLDIVYATYHVDIGETPFYVAVDHDRRSVVISIRGTLSLQDVLTDLKADAEILPVEPMNEDCFAHKGMVQAAAYINKKIKDEQLLAPAFNSDPERGTRDYDVVVVGHSLGAGTAAILAILLRQDYPNLHCYAYSPPGGLLSEKCVEETKSFITSVVVGKDVVPRIGLHQLEVFRQDVINMIKKCVQPKWKVIGRSVMCCGCQGDDDVSTSSTNEMSDVMLRDVSEPITSSFIHPGDSHVSLSKHAPLCLPGNIIHVVRNHPSSAHVTCCRSEEPTYEALWADKKDFNEVLISPTMISDHMPDNVLDALEKVLEHVGRTDRRHHHPAADLATSADTGSAANKPATAAAACIIEFDDCMGPLTSAIADVVDFRSRDAPGTLEMDAECDVSVTTTTLVRDSTLDSVTSPCASPQPLALLVDPEMEARPGRVDLGSTKVDVVSTAADMEHCNAAEHLLRDDQTRSHCVVVDDVIPEPETYCPGNGADFIEANPLMSHRNRKLMPAGNDVTCSTIIDNDVIPEPETSWPGSGALCVEAGPRDVRSEPEVVVHPVDNQSSNLSNSISFANDGARQYLYDAVEGHYSPAGRGYPHGFLRYSPVRELRTRSCPQSPDDRDDRVDSDFSVP